MKLSLLHCRLLLILVLFALMRPPVSAQFFDDEVCKIAHYEAMAAAKKMSFKSHGLSTNYDVTYQQMQWRVNPDQRFISGEVYTEFRALEDMNRLYFDLHSALVVDSVRGRNGRLSYTHRDDDILEIELTEDVAASEFDSVTVWYHGVPPTTGFGSFEQSTHNGNGVLWTLSEPYGAKDWWPCKQDLQDKIDSVDIFITCPAGNKAGSNGSLEAVTNLPNNRVRYHWKHRYSIPTYLIAIAVTNYVEFSDYADLTEGRLEVLNYVYPEDFAVLEPDAKRVIPLLELYDTLVGPYPYMKEKYGHAQFGWGGGMEHATMSFMGSLHYELVAHELAHQWFGDKITCGSWEDIWLNEGFATYFTGISYQYLFPPGLWDRWKRINIERVTREDGGSVHVEDTLDVARIFDQRLSYYKGALVLHMLRWKMGDRDFYQAIRNYISDPDLAFSFAVTDDLQYHLEQQHGGSLEEFFQDWYYGEGFPIYFIQWAQQDDRLMLKIDQNSSHSSVDFFEMPVPVYFSGEGQDTTLVFEHGVDGQVFARQLNFTVDSAYFDPEQWLLARLGNLYKVAAISGEDMVPAVYPNPARGKVKILGYWEKLLMVDERGQTVRNLRKEQISDDLVELDISDLRAGTYFLWFDNLVQELVVVP